MQLGANLPLWDIGGDPAVVRDFSQAAEDMGFDYLGAADHVIGVNEANRPEVVELGNGITEDDLLFHDEQSPEPSLAFMLARMRYPEFPEPMGVFRDVERPVYDEQVELQMNAARESKGDGDLEALFNTGDTWTVE